MFLLHLARPEKQLCANCTCHEMILLVLMKQLILCSHLVSSTKVCLRILFSSLSKPVFLFPQNLKLEGTEDLSDVLVMQGD